MAAVKGEVTVKKLEKGLPQLDRSEQDDQLTESCGVHYIRDKRHSKTFTEIKMKKKEGFRDGSIEQAVKKIFGGK